jgi:sec-independent protein translocase protein TatC
MKLRKRLAPAADDQQGMTVIEHLAELRKRIIIALAALTVGVVVAFLQQERVFTLLKRPLLSSGVQAQLITLSPRTVHDGLRSITRVSTRLPIIRQFGQHHAALYEQNGRWSCLRL